jgi:hypothetical protein
LHHNPAIVEVSGNSSWNLATVAGFQTVLLESGCTVPDSGETY